MQDFTNVFSHADVSINQNTNFDDNTLAWRKDEIAQIEEFNSHQGYAGMVLYGLRQTGKSYFLKRFYRDKPCIFFEASRVSVEECFAYFKMAVDKYLADWNIDLSGNLQKYYTEAVDMTHMFIFISILAEQYKFTLVIDEFNYLQELIPEVATSIQWIIDHVKDLDNVAFKIVLCGSNIGILQKVPSYDSPLFGRISWILPFAPVSVLSLLKLLNYQQIGERYMTATLTGGLPELILIAQQCNSFEEFVETAYLRANSRFRSIPTNLLLANRVDPDDAIRIFNAIFSGSSKLNDIKQRSGLSVEFDSVFNKLLDCGFIQERKPLYSRRKTQVYAIGNAALEFTYLFNLQSTPDTLHLVGAHFSDLKADQIATFMGKYFEKVCREYLILHNPLRTTFLQIGYWEDTIKDGACNHSEEFDIIAQTINKEQLLVGECKFRNEVFDIKTYQALKDKARYVDSPARDIVYCLFSKSGFSKQLILEAEKNPHNVRLYTLEDLVTG